MEEITGAVEKVIYSNESDGYAVICLKTGKGVAVAVGIFPPVGVGDELCLKGEFVVNRKYGTQFRADSVTYGRPAASEAIVKYLSGGIFPGIGPALASRIVGAFGAKTLDVMDSEPNRLLEVPGIGKRKLKRIESAYGQTRRMRETILFLQQYDVTLNLACKIFKKLGDNAVPLIKANPYILIKEIGGVGFKTADKIGAKFGIPRDSAMRIKAGIAHVLSEAAGQCGHTCLPERALFAEAQKLLEAPVESIRDAYREMPELRREPIGQSICVASGLNYAVESGIAYRLLALDALVRRSDIDIASELEAFGRKSDIRLAENQKKAIFSVFSNGVSVITGGPGTGKTTLIKCIVDVCENNGRRVVLCAPTGRAGRRMTEATGREAKTIHRTLGIESDISRRTYDKKNRLPCDVVVVDEISMCDIYVFFALVEAIPIGARLVLVGDKDQLPSVACGNILSDALKSGMINSVRLTDVFRQKEGGEIVLNAHRINRGEMPIVSNCKDFFMSFKSDPIAAQNEILTLVRERIPAYSGLKPSDIQVLAPRRKTALGVEALNAVLQSALNPSPHSLTHRDRTFKLGDRVMHTVNDYNLEWRSPDGKERGLGIFNGDIGIINQVGNDFVRVDYGDGRLVRYDSSALDELTLAYCVSVHKSQGSEFPAVVLALGSISPYLLTRNLIYTAVTRAKKLVVIVGEEFVLRYAVRNNYTAKRYSMLCHMLRKGKDCLNSLLTPPSAPQDRDSQ